jgi:histidyl-tRNA synthetase
MPNPLEALIFQRRQQLEGQKQMKYANANSVSWVAMIGEDEIKNKSIRIKNMITGVQEDVSLEVLIEKIQH